MSAPIHVALYSDISCPYAYLTVYRLRQLRAEYRGRIVIEHKSLSLEYVNKRGTPKPILDSETPFLLLEEPEIAYQPWQRPDSEWPVTISPAFEAVKCAQRQSFELADDLDWAIRVAFFAESRCISLRSVLFEIAQNISALDMQRFADDFDRGVTKYQVLQDARAGWEQLKVSGSPTIVLPSGKQVSDLGFPYVKLDKERNYRVASVRPASCDGQDCLDVFRRLFAEIEAGAEA